MMSRPVSIGTGVREIIGGSVQAVFGAGGTLIILVLGCLGVWKQFGNSIHQSFMKRIL